jgi:hypothetical protein
MVRAAFSKDTPLGMVGKIVLTIWCVLSVWIAGQLTFYLLLVVRYGFIRVYKEHIHAVPNPDTSKYADIILSNGDYLTYFEPQAMIPVTFVLLAVLILVGYLVIKHCSKRMKQAQLERTLSDA